MSYIDIDVFVHNDSTKLMNNLDMDFDLETCDIKTIRLYDITYIMPYEENGKTYTQIFTHSQGLVSPIPFDDFKIIANVLLK